MFRSYFMRQHRPRCQRSLRLRRWRQPVHESAHGVIGIQVLIHCCYFQILLFQLYSLSSTVFARPALQPFLTLFSVGKMMRRTRKKKTKTWVINRSCVVWSQDYFIHLVSDRWWCHFQRPISGPRFSLGSPAPRSHGRCGSVRSGLRGLPQVAGGRLCPRVQPAVGSHRGQSGENDIAWYTHFQPLSRDNVQLRNGYNLKWEYQY